MNRSSVHSARYALPEFTERTSTGTRTVDPYSKLLAERIVFLGTAVDDAAANDVTAQFMHLEHAAPGQAISLYINSPGGSHTAMSAIYDTIRFVSCDVETIYRLHVAAHEPDGVVDRGHRGVRAAGGVDVERDGLAGSGVFEVHELRRHVVGRGVVDGRSQEDDPLREQLRVRIDRAGPGAGALRELGQCVSGAVDAGSVHGGASEVSVKNVQDVQLVLWGAWPMRFR